jgi:hypothetical protein
MVEEGAGRGVTSNRGRRCAGKLSWRLFVLVPTYLPLVYVHLWITINLSRSSRPVNRITSGHGSACAPEKNGDYTLVLCRSLLHWGYAMRHHDLELLMQPAVKVRRRRRSSSTRRPDQEHRASSDCTRQLPY